MSVLSPHLITTRAELKAAVARLCDSDAFAFDVETDGLNVHTNWVTWIGLATYGQTYLIPMGQTKGRMVRPGYIEKVLPPDEERAVLKNGQLSQRKIDRKVPALFAAPPAQLDPALVFGELEPLFFGDAIKIAFNARFDLLTICKYYGGIIPSGPYEDPMIMTHVLDENRRIYDLKDIILDWLNIRDKDKRKAFYPKLGKTIQEEPIDAVARYLSKDAYLLWTYWKNARSMLIREGLMSVLKLEMDLYPALMRMQTHGIGIDIDKLNEVGKELEEEMDQTAERAWTEVGHDFPMTNNNVKRDLLFKSKKQGGQGLAPLSFTPKTNTPVIDAFTLDYYAPTNDLARIFKHWALIQKLHSTYIVGLQAKATITADGQAFLHTQLTQHRAVTGRFTSTEPNLQNIPRVGSGANIREMFIAPPGYMLVVADYNQIELRVFAHFLKDPVMLAIFEADEDIHAATASYILHKKVAALTDEERTNAGKQVNFAVSYGAGPGRIAATTGTDMATAQAFYDRYLHRFVTIKPWRQAVLLEAHRRGNRGDPRRYPPYTTTLLGRRRRLPDLYDFNDRKLQSRAERQGWNHCIQGTAAEIMKIAMIRVDKAFLPTPFKLLLTVHDELIALAPESRAEECQQVMKSAMSGIMVGDKPIIRVPLVVKCGIGRAWDEAKG